ncbi:MAG: cytochrome c3 family protein [Proteobacteria bacterium]|nr:cytochrome c3 family protein [Pseudomonadota bacterium]
MRHQVRTTSQAAMLLLLSAFIGGCPPADEYAGDENHPRAPHQLFPEYTSENGQIAAGATTGEGPEQPIAFPHNTHVQTLGMECEFCHSEARKSLHAGVPPTQTCMNCHKYVKTDSPEIKRVAEYYEKGEAIPWNKVHDLPDYVHFEHKRHVRAGVDCTECHGQVPLLSGVRNEDGVVEGTMIRETTLQMGWCLGCHETHPSVNENYGEKADLRRAELKDCWTCHK